MMKEQNKNITYNPDGIPLPLEGEGSGERVCSFPDGLLPIEGEVPAGRRGSLEGQGERVFLLFNPSNDMALAANSLSYFPPRQIQQMEEELALLPLWWAEEGDCVLNTIDRSDSSLFSRFSSIKPWGWSLALRHRLLHMGFPESSLPTKEQLEDYRNLSSRAFAADYIQQLFADADRDGWSDNLVGRGMQTIGAPLPHPLSPIGRGVTNAIGDPLPDLPHNGEVTNAIAKDESVPDGKDSSLFALHSSLIFKTLWSSSGRGVFVYRPDEPFNWDRVNASIRKQGGILMDDFYEEKLLDFALEFEIGNPLSFLGFSVFEASSSGTYGGNIVASQESLRERILSTGVSAELLDRLIEYSASKLGELLAGRYTGVFGIDMIVCRHEGKIKIHPCIEINLRRNMGILAIDLYKRLGDNANKVLAGNPENGFCAQVKDGVLNITYRTDPLPASPSKGR